MINNIYIYNNFIDLINLINYLIFNKIKPGNIKNNFYSPNLFDNLIYLNLHENNLKNIVNLIGKNNYKILYYVYLSQNNNKELIMYYFYLNSVIYQSKIIYQRNLRCVNEALKISNYVKHEIHKFKGFTRFRELKNKVMYSEINPENNIIEVISNYFQNRLKNEYWIIKDVNRNLLSLYNKIDFVIVSEEECKLLESEISNNELEIEQLWIKFYHTIGIKERKNDRCRMNFMPKKYWQYILEVSNEKSD